jgi:arginyl-tRNA synthetase
VEFRIANGDGTETVLGTGTLDAYGGIATFSTSVLSVGTHPIVAYYLGDNYFNVSNSPVLNQVVNEAETQTTLTSDINPSKFGQTVTFTATVTDITSGGGIPTGPMHIGNARGGALGDFLSSVLDFAGYKVSREFYVNDAGNQIIKMSQSLKARYLQIIFGTDKIEFPEDGYQGADITELAQLFYDEYGDAYKNADDEILCEKLIEFALPVNINKLKNDLLKYRIEYDNWFLESELHKNGGVNRVIGLLKNSGFTYEKDGALWFKAGGDDAENDYVLVRGNGVPTYIVPDIAYHYNKFITRGHDRAIDVLGADHHGYAPRLKAAMSALGIDESRLEFVLMQMVRLVRDGEVIKASKRTGKSITLSTLLDEVPIDAARFFFNLRDPNTHFDFDLDLAIEQSSQNPVYYVQYAHARVFSILRFLETDGIRPLAPEETDFSLLKEPAERLLIRHLSEFTGEIERAARELNPARITKYVLETASLFHKFYDLCRIKCEPEALMQARLHLCLCTKAVIANVLGLMKIEAPEVM